MSNNSVRRNSDIITYFNSSISSTVRKKSHIVAYCRNTIIRSSSNAHTWINTKVITNYDFIFHNISIMKYFIHLKVFNMRNSLYNSVLII